MDKSFVGQWPSSSEQWVPTLLQLTAHLKEGGGGGAALRRWFEIGFDSLGGELRSNVLDMAHNQASQAVGPVKGISAALFSGHLGSTGYQERRREYSPSTWQEFLAELENLPRMASLELFALNSNGMPVNPSMLISSQRFGHAGEWLTLAIMIKPQLQPDDGRWPPALDLLKRTAETVEVSHGSISFLDSIFSTPLELALHMPSEDAIPRSRKLLRGYGWITILGEEMGTRLGGETGLRNTGAFAEVAHLSNGGFWLKATSFLGAYRGPQAEKVRSVLAPLLPNAGYVK
ncbi:hypothetical protein [Micromonospora sp. NPDC006431]|uniref:hypothetical protein n=1 Tax=Micromonospora sp. NPDC006431 TaxID=3364235 RepID=UPI00369AA080